MNNFSQCKTRCPFIQYMANKPDKFGIKFWLFADAQSKYLCNGKPYLGRDPSRSRCSDLPGDVCLTLLQPYYKKGCNVTTDNYFTSLKLVEELKQKKNNNSWHYTEITTRSAKHSADNERQGIICF